MQYDVVPRYEKKTIPMKIRHITAKASKIDGLNICFTSSLYQFTF